MKCENVFISYFYFTTARFLCFTLYYQIFPSVSVDSPKINEEPKTALVLAWRGCRKSQKISLQAQVRKQKLTYCKGNYRNLRVKMRNYREFIITLEHRSFNSIFLHS
jgi:hypothetical protein